MGISLLDTFRNLDKAIKESLADIDSPLLLAFAALDIAENKAGVERLTAEHITACLEAAGVAISKRSITNALARAGNKVSKSNIDDGEISYKLMILGKREVENLLGGESLAVVRIEGGTPRTARIRLGEILSKLKGTVRICDPYYGVRTLDTLDYLPKSCKVNFLTAKTNDGAAKLQGALKDFKKEKPNVEFRLANNPNDLHDRYIVTNESLIILGHGLKDIGGKESFMITLDKKLAPDLINDVIHTFDARWKMATNI